MKITKALFTLTTMYTLSVMSISIAGSASESKKVQDKNTTTTDNSKPDEPGKLKKKMNDLSGSIAAAAKKLSELTMKKSTKILETTKGELKNLIDGGKEKLNSTGQKIKEESKTISADVEDSLAAGLEEMSSGIDSFVESIQE